MEQKSNRQIVLECYRKIIRDLDLSLVDEYVSDNYIQHSPTVKDGKAGLLEMLGFLKTLPKPAERGPSPIIRTIAEDDMVAVHLDIKFMGQRVAVIDLFRLVDGKIAEHWDVGQALAAGDDGLITMTNGTTVIDGAAEAGTNKQLIKDFYNDEDAGKYLAAGYIEHNTIRPLLSNIGKDVKLHRIIGEGDFVVAHSEVNKTGNHFARVDIFRIDAGKISEHWSVEQAVPENMAHGNGMF